MGLHIIDHDTGNTVPMFFLFNIKTIRTEPQHAQHLIREPLGAKHPKITHWDAYEGKHWVSSSEL